MHNGLPLPSKCWVASLRFMHALNNQRPDSLPFQSSLVIQTHLFHWYGIECDACSSLIIFRNASQSVSQQHNASRNSRPFATFYINAIIISFSLRFVFQLFQTNQTASCVFNFLSSWTAAHSNHSFPSASPSLFFLLLLLLSSCVCWNAFF